MTLLMPLEDEFGFEGFTTERIDTLEGANVAVYCGVHVDLLFGRLFHAANGTHPNMSTSVGTRSNGKMLILGLSIKLKKL